jgi:hypothetical protein
MLLSNLARLGLSLAIQLGSLSKLMQVLFLLGRYVLPIGEPLLLVELNVTFVENSSS